jgi:hypothetical protein
MKEGTRYGLWRAYSLQTATELSKMFVSLGAKFF